jgi:hypothetical protein
MGCPANHQSKVWHDLKSGPPEAGMPPCTCPLDGTAVSPVCRQCQNASHQCTGSVDAQQRAAYDALLEIFPEPCGQQFPEEPPEDLPG